MAQPTNATPLVDIHPRLHNFHINVKMFGAVGDGSTDDTTAIQAALDAAQSSSGGGICYFPPGNYKITSSLLFEGNADTTGAEGVQILGANGTDSDPSPGTWVRPGVRIFGTFNDYLLKRVSTSDGSSCTINNIGFHNLHATGKCLNVTQVINCKISNCWFRGYIGLRVGDNAFQVSVENCAFAGPGSNSIGSRGILGGVVACRDIDVTSYEKGVTGNGITVNGFRVENCVYAFYLGVDVNETVNNWGGRIETGSTEACDYGVYVRKGSGIIMGVGVNGTAASPSGHGVGGFVTEERGNGLTFIGCATSGTHTNDFDIKNNATVENTMLINCRGNSGTWSIGNFSNLELIRCANGVSDVRRLPVIATGSLPAASAQRDGQAIIEDNGTGDRNLIIYAGGQRFRIDGGSAF